MEGYVSKPIRPAELVAELEATPALASAATAAEPARRRPIRSGGWLSGRPTEGRRRADGREGPDRRARGTRGRAQRARAVQAALYRIAEAASAAEDLAGLLPDDPRDRRRADVRGELLHRAVRRRARPDQLPVLRRHRSTPTSRTRMPGSRSASATPAASTAYVLRTRSRRCSIDGAELPASSGTRGEIELLGVVGRRRLARRAAVGRGADARRPGRPGLTSTEHTYTRGRPRPARLRRPARRLRADAGSGPSRRRASGTPSWPSSTRSATPSPGSSTSRRSSSSSANGFGSLFDARSMFIAIYDESTGMIDVPVRDRRGRRYRSEPLALGPGLTSHVIRTRRPLRLGTLEESVALGAVISTSLAREALPSAPGTGPDAPGANDGREAESWLGVPILIGERVIGVIGLESLEQHAFDEATSGSLERSRRAWACALENARLFDETKRLLGETERAQGRAGGHQRDRRRARQPARLPGDHRARRRAGASAVRTRSRCSSPCTTSRRP